MAEGRWRKARGVIEVALRAPRRRPGSSSAARLGPGLRRDTMHLLYTPMIVRAVACHQSVFQTVWTNKAAGMKNAAQIQ